MRSLRGTGDKIAGGTGGAQSEAVTGQNAGGTGALTPRESLQLTSDSNSGNHPRDRRPRTTAAGLERRRFLEAMLYGVKAHDAASFTAAAAIVIVVGASSAR